jgi:phosphomethylpyrimidine synthase
MTQLELAKRGVISEEVKRVAKSEGISLELLRRRVAKGWIVILKNFARKEEVEPLGIGNGLRTKVNVNVGTSPDICDLKLELKKARIAMRFGADTIMDLSTGGDLDRIRKALMRVAPIPFGTVPIYQAAIEAQRKHGAIVLMSEDEIFNSIEKHAKQGVDFMTVHCGITKESIASLIRQKRLLGIVSRGGTFLAAWMKHHGKENPLYKNFDYLLEVAKKYDVVLSLGDALRPGCIADATDKPQLKELSILGRLVKFCRRAGVQAMIEGPGHIPLNQIALNVKLEKQICSNAPFYVLGPLVTDIAPGYDHLVGAIGGALAALYGADFLCYLTPAEHIALPTLEDVKEGLIVTKIAAHAADIAKGRGMSLDEEISKARAMLDWKKQCELAINPEKLKRIRKERPPRKLADVCTMCGEFCAIRLLSKYFRARH